MSAIEYCSQCKTKTAMVLRPAKELSKDMAWCGAWYDCPQCRTTRLIMSQGLKDFHAAMGISTEPTPKPKRQRQTAAQRRATGQAA